MSNAVARPARRSTGDWLPVAALTDELRDDVLAPPPMVDRINNDLMGTEYEWGKMNMHLRQVPNHNTEQEDEDDGSDV